MGQFLRECGIGKGGMVEAGQVVFQQGFKVAYGVVRRPSARLRYKFTSVAFLPSSFTFSSWHRPMNSWSSSSRARLPPR